jgi:hypothetical protein
MEIAMKFRNFGLLLLAILAFSNGHARSDSFPCGAGQNCNNLWVAAHNIGSAEVFFKKNTNSIGPADIQTGDELVAERDINVRSGPANWQRPTFTIPKSGRVKIAELRTLYTDDGRSQLWLRIVAPASGPAVPPITVPPNTPVVAVPCMQTAPTDTELSPPIIIPPVTSNPPTPADVIRLLEGRDIYCDQYGLIVHKDDNGKFNGGDTAQREGWYWLGVWIRQNTPGLQPWNHQRRLNFNQVMSLLEPNGDGIFYRHPKQAPFNNPFDKEWGLSRDQLIPLVAAMGVYGRTDAIKRLWSALPEDFVGKRSFNGNWRNFLGQDGTNCTDIKKRSCDPTADCSLKVDNRICTLSVDGRDCSPQVDNRDCSANEDKRNCEGNFISKSYCEGQKATQNAAYATSKATCETAKATQNTAYSAAKATCEVEKASQNAAYVAIKDSCEVGKTAQNVLYAGDKASCELAKTAGRGACEADKAIATTFCQFTNVHSGDLIGPSTVNLFLRALNRDPLTSNWWIDELPTTIIHGGLEGEGELLFNQYLIVGDSWDNKDASGNDLNNIIMLLMSKLRYPSAISAEAINVYVGQRRHSYGSYFRSYYQRYGDSVLDLTNRFDQGIASGWQPDVSAPAGAARWYHRPSNGANPQLATLYISIIDRLLH